VVTNRLTRCLDLQSISNRSGKKLPAVRREIAVLLRTEAPPSRCAVLCAEILTSIHISNNRRVFLKIRTPNSAKACNCHETTSGIIGQPSAAAGNVCIHCLDGLLALLQQVPDSLFALSRRKPLLGRNSQSYPTSSHVLQP
jgi:hypothetical protein